MIRRSNKVSYNINTNKTPRTQNYKSVRRLSILGQEMASLLRIITILFLLFLPYVAYDIFEANDIANTFPDYKESISLTKQSPYKHFLNDFPSNTGFSVKVTKTSSSISVLNMILLSEKTFDLYEDGEQLSGYFVQEPIGLSNTEGQMNILFELPLPLYIIIEYVEGNEIEIQLSLEISIFYDPIFIREGITILSAAAIYGFSVIYLDNKIVELKTQRAILRYEQNKLDQEEEFLDKLLGPLEK